MQQPTEKPKKASDWSLPVSILIHAAIVAVFLGAIPAPQATPDKEQAVDVELVPPPEKTPDEKKPDVAKQDEKKPEEPKPPEQPPVKPPEMPKAETKKEDPPPPKPTAPKPAEEAKKAEEPPKAPEPKPEPKPPEQPKQEAEKPPPKQSIPVMQQVFEFGDEDSGPKVSEKGNAADAATNPDDKPATSQPPAKPDQTKPPEQPPAARPVPQDITLPKVQTADTHSEKDAPDAFGINEAKTSFEPDKAPEVTKPAQEDASAVPTPDAKPVEDDTLKRPKTLFSPKATSDTRGKKAMGKLSRGLRVGQLCMSELNVRLQQATPSYNPVLMPAYEAPEGNLFAITRGQFRNTDGWYNVSFQCQVNDGGTKVVGFQFAVGGRIPRSEWASRRIPADDGL